MDVVFNKSDEIITASLEDPVQLVDIQQIDLDQTLTGLLTRAYIEESVRKCHDQDLTRRGCLLSDLQRSGAPMDVVSLSMSNSSFQLSFSDSSDVSYTTSHISRDVSSLPVDLAQGKLPLELPSNSAQSACLLRSRIRDTLVLVQRHQSYSGVDEEAVIVNQTPICLDPSPAVTVTKNHILHRGRRLWSRRFYRFLRRRHSNVRSSAEKALLCTRQVLNEFNTFPLGRRVEKATKLDPPTGFKLQVGPYKKYDFPLEKKKVSEYRLSVTRRSVVEDVHVAVYKLYDHYQVEERRVLYPDGATSPATTHTSVPDFEAARNAVRQLHALFTEDSSNDALTEHISGQILLEEPTKLKMVDPWTGEEIVT